MGHPVLDIGVMGGDGVAVGQREPAAEHPSVGRAGRYGGPHCTVCHQPSDGPTGLVLQCVARTLSMG